MSEQTTLRPAAVAWGWRPSTWRLGWWRWHAERDWWLCLGPIAVLFQAKPCAVAGFRFWMPDDEQDG